MNTTCETVSCASSEEFDLVCQQKLVVQRKPKTSLLQIIGCNGSLALEILVTEEGPVVRMESSSLEIHVQGDLSLSSDHLSVHGRKSLSLTSGGNIRIGTPGDLSSEARSQKVTAHLGNVDIKANDDVTMNGERIRMNC